MGNQRKTHGSELLGLVRPSPEGSGLGAQLGEFDPIATGIMDEYLTVDARYLSRHSEFDFFGFEVASALLDVGDRQREVLATIDEGVGTNKKMQLVGADSEPGPVDGESGPIERGESETIDVKSQRLGQ